MKKNVFFFKNKKRKKIEHYNTEYLDVISFVFLFFFLLLLLSNDIWCKWKKKEENCDIVNKYFYYDIIIVVLYYYSLLFIEHLNEKKVCFKLKLSVIF